MKPKISICIPSYESKGRGVEFIQRSINSILKQTYSNFEIIISDHSIDDKIKDYVNSLNNSKINYLRYSENIGWPAHNTNNSIKHSTGDYIKLMNLDDYMEDFDTLEKIVDKLNMGYKWVLCGFKHKNLNSGDYSNPIIPTINGDGKHLLMGVNTVGCPSVALIPKDVYFDPNVLYMIDCELWYRLFINYGNPGIINEYKIVIGIGDHTLTTKLQSKQNEWLDKDKEYCKIKFKL